MFLAKTKETLAKVTAVLLLASGTPAMAECQILKISDGFFTQTGNGNVFSSRSTGAYRAQLNISNFDATVAPLTLGNPNTVTPAGIGRDKVGIIYDFYLSDGTKVLTTSVTALEVTSFTYNQPLPSSFILFVDVEVKEQSGVKTTTEDYRLSVNVSC